MGTSSHQPAAPRGRGSAGNPPNRFERTHREREEDADPAEESSPRTQFLVDHSETVLTHNESPDIPFRFSLKAAAAAGARWAGMAVLRLPLAVGPLFEDWLEREEPLRKQKILAGIRSVRDGLLDDARFGTRMTGRGRLAEQIAALFDAARRRARLDDSSPALSSAAFRRLPGRQLELL